MATKTFLGIKRIWFLWLATAYVLVHAVTIPFQLYLGQYIFAVAGIAMTIIVGRAVWERRRYLWDKNEY